MNENATVDIACTLDVTDFGTRVGEWRDLARYATERQVYEGRAVALYPRDETLRARLARLIEAESECCPFLRFDIREEGDSIRVELTYPPEAEAMLDQVIGIR